MKVSSQKEESFCVKMSVLLAIFLSILVTVNCQRSPYAGSRPGSGYKDTYLSQSSPSSTTGQNVADVGNRVGESSTSATIGGTTNPLPVEAYGDRFIVDHYNSLPVEQRPFWILNQEHINIHRGSPQQQMAGNAANAGNSGLNNIQSSTNSVPAGNGAQVGERFGESNNFNPYQQLPTVGNYQQVVYPVNTSPLQRVDLEIQFLQNRLESLQRQRQQLSQQTSTQNGQLNQQGQQVQQVQQQMQQRNQRSPYDGQVF